MKMINNTPKTNRKQINTNNKQNQKQAYITSLKSAASGSEKYTPQLIIALLL